MSIARGPTVGAVMVAGWWTDSHL